MTIRVLHLLQPRWTGPAALDAVATLQREGASRGIAHHAFVIGGSADERAARRMGVWCLERMTDARPARLILSGSRTLRRVLARRTAFDALHAWTPAAAIVARLAAPEIPCAMREPWWAPMDVERLKGVDRAGRGGRGAWRKARSWWRWRAERRGGWTRSGSRWESAWRRRRDGGWWDLRRRGRIRWSGRCGCGMARPRRGGWWSRMSLRGGWRSARRRWCARCGAIGAAGRCGPISGRACGRARRGRK